MARILKLCHKSVDDSLKNKQITQSSRFCISMLGEDGNAMVIWGQQQGGRLAQEELQ